MDRIQLVALLTAIIHLTDTLFYPVRLSGVRTRRLVTAISLYQLIALLAGVANMVQAPLLSAVVEQAINAGQASYQAHLQHLLGGIRLIILAGSVGTAAAMMIAPIFILFMGRVVFIYERTGSLSLLLLLPFSPARIARVAGELAAALARRRRRPSSSRSLWCPGRQALADLLLRGRPMPIGLFLVHIIVVSIWTNAVLASLYAGALLPSYRSTASLLSGIVNGVAAVLATFLIDPVTAVITDQALQGLRDERDITSLTYWLMFTRLLGTLLAQLIFIPTSHLVELLTHMMT